MWSGISLAHKHTHALTQVTLIPRTGKEHQGGGKMSPLSGDQVQRVMTDFPLEYLSTASTSEHLQDFNGKLPVCFNHWVGVGVCSLGLVNNNQTHPE